MLRELSASVQNFGVFSRRRMAGRGPREGGMAAVCGAGGSKRPVAGHPGAHEAAEEVWGAAGLGGIPIEVLVRDQGAVAPQGDGTVVLRRGLATGFGASGNRLGDLLAVSGSGF